MWPQSWGRLESRGLSRPALATVMLLFSEGATVWGWLDPAFSFKGEGGLGWGGDAEASFRRSRPYCPAFVYISVF